MSTFRDQGFEMVGETINSGFVCESFADSIALTGSNQATGTMLTANRNVIASGSVCVLPLSAPAGAVITVTNQGAAIVTPYPPVGGQISTYGTNTAGATLAAISSNVATVGRYVSRGSGNYVVC